MTTDVMTSLLQEGVSLQTTIAEGFSAARRRVSQKFNNDNRLAFSILRGFSALQQPAGGGQSDDRTGNPHVARAAVNQSFSFST